MPSPWACRWWHRVTSKLAGVDAGSNCVLLCEVRLVPAGLLMWVLWEGEDECERFDGGRRGEERRGREDL